MRRSKQRRIKRKPDLRKIRTSHVYTRAEIAKDLYRGLPTVKRWINNGLPTIEGSNPPLVDGAVLKAWQTQKWQSKKRPCNEGELYCCTCHTPQKSLIGSVSLEPKTDKTITIKGKCSECGGKQCQTGSLAKLDEIQLAFCLLPQAVQHLLGCNDTSVSDNIIPFSKVKPKHEEKHSQLSMLDILQKSEKQ